MSDDAKDPQSTGRGGIKRPRSTEDHKSMDTGESVKRTSLGSSQDQLSLPPKDSIHQLRLEAIFYPKFEQERSDQQVRKDMLSLVGKGLGYLDVTLKHSGSLILWSGGSRFYSKNSAHNQFTLVAELLLRQHFERAWRQSQPTESANRGIHMYQECSRYLQEKRLTCAFEAVTSVLGDHGDIPKRDFLVLTAVADRSTEGFHSTPELLELAQRFRLPHNDSWMFSKTKSAEQLFQLYDTTRETGLATDTIKALTAAAQGHIVSMYPHSVFQGEILEGVIVRYIPYTEAFQSADKVQEKLGSLATKAQEILQVVPPELPASYQVHTSSPLVWSTNIRTLFQHVDGYSKGMAAATKFTEELEKILSDQGDASRATLSRLVDRGISIPALTKDLVNSPDSETQRVARLLHNITDLNKAVTYSVVREERIAEGPDSSPSHRWLCTVHVLHDKTFLMFQKRKQQEDMHLFRGFCIELVVKDGNSTDAPPCDTSPMEIDVSAEPKQTPLSAAQPSLMLKMKFLPYMIRTFICRNQLNILRQDGPNSFLHSSSKLMRKWEISKEGTQRWLPFLRSWASYAKHSMAHPNSSSTLPPLTDFSYLRHLEDFTQKFESGEIIQEDESTFGGVVLVVSPEEERAHTLALKLAQALKGVEVLNINEAVKRPYLQGFVCFGGLECWGRKTREFTKQVESYSAAVFLGCSPEEIKTGEKSENEIKKCVGLSKGWKNQVYKATIDLPISSIDGEEPTGEFTDAVRRINEVAPGSPPDSEQKPGLLVMMVGIPGCGKSSILDSLGDDITAALAKLPNGNSREVHIFEGDRMGKKTFWNEMNKQRSDDSSCICIADKNAVPTAWKAFGGVCSSNGGVPLPVLPDASVLKTTQIKGARMPDGSFEEDTVHFYPFTLTYLAMCMARVSKRMPGSHPGKLDSDAPLACMVVAQFFAFFRSIAAEELKETIMSQLRRAGVSSMEPISVPFLGTSDDSLPDEVESVLVAALQLHLGLKRAKTKLKPGDSIQAEMEEKLRLCMAKHGDEILSKSVDLSSSRQGLVEQLAERVPQLDEQAPLDVPEIVGGEKVKLVSVDIDSADVHRVLREHILQLAPGFVETALGRNQDVHFSGKTFTPNTHVTMSYWERTTQETIRTNFGSLQGCKVNVMVKGFIWDKKVAAFCVQVDSVSQDGKTVPACENEFEHVTVWVSEGARASMSNYLPKSVKLGRAGQVLLPTPVPLEGTISLWDFENKPLPVDSGATSK